MNGVGGSPPSGSCSLPSVPTVSPLLSSPSLAPLLQVFSNEGQFKFRFGVRGRSPGQLQRPTGVAVDTNGDIIVADYDNRWVSIFSPEGKFKVRGLRSLSSAALVASRADLSGASWWSGPGPANPSSASGSVLVPDWDCSPHQAAPNG